MKLEHYFDQDKVFQHLIDCDQAQKDQSVKLKAKIEHDLDVTVLIWDDKTVTLQFPNDIVDKIRKEYKTTKELFEEISE